MRMTPEQEKAAQELWGAQVAKSLAALGIMAMPNHRYRLKSIYDTQSIPAANQSSVDFFATTTSSRALHARLAHGCNLKEPGLLGDKFQFVVLSYGFDLVEQNAGVAADANDVAILNDYGQITSVQINDQIVDENIPLNACGMNRGFRFDHILAGAPAALDFDSVANGQPGNGGRGYELAPFSRFLIEGGESIKVVVAHDGAAALAAAQMARVHLFGLEIKRR